MTAYATQTDVLQAAGRIGYTPTTAEAAALATAIAQATAWVEKATGTFFDQRHQQVITEPVNVRQTNLFLHAPCISIDNGTITEDGNALVQGTDFFLYQPTQSGIPTGPGYLQKAANSGLSGNWGGFNLKPLPMPWSNNQQAIIIPGTFGFVAVPQDITKAVAWVAAKMLGWVTVSYVENGGISKAVLDLKIPDWVATTLANRAPSHLDQQIFIVTELA